MHSNASNLFLHHTVKLREGLLSGWDFCSKETHFSGSFGFLFGSAFSSAIDISEAITSRLDGIDFSVVDISESDLSEAQATNLDDALSSSCTSMMVDIFSDISMMVDVFLDSVSSSSNEALTR